MADPAVETVFITIRRVVPVFVAVTFLHASSMRSVHGTYITALIGRSRVLLLHPASIVCTICTVLARLFYGLPAIVVIVCYGRSTRASSPGIAENLALGRYCSVLWPPLGPSDLESRSDAHLEGLSTASHRLIRIIKPVTVIINITPESILKAVFVTVTHTTVFITVKFQHACFI